MTTVFNKAGTKWFPADARDMVVAPTLPAVNLTIKKDPMSGQLFFEEIEGYAYPSKIYGDISQRADRILNTFIERPYQTGVLLSGEKGSGKSMLAKLVSTLAARHGFPTLTINAPWSGDQFFQLIQKVEQPMVILFDEFEKVYDQKTQKEVLTLLDGVFPTKKLFILTVNDIYQVDRHMQNRPGRLFYSIEYKGLNEGFIHDYCRDQLKDWSEQSVERIVNVSRLFTSNEPFNFDMLKALVEEMNRYNETPAQALEMLNINPRQQQSKYLVEDLIVYGYRVPKADVDNDYLWCAPLFDDEISISMDLPDALVQKLESEGLISPGNSSTDADLDQAIDALEKRMKRDAAVAASDAPEASETDGAAAEKITKTNVDIEVGRDDLENVNVGQGIYRYKTPAVSFSLRREAARAGSTRNGWDYL